MASSTAQALKKKNKWAEEEEEEEETQHVNIFFQLFFVSLTY
jgi:hypothetical protein